MPRYTSFADAEQRRRDIEQDLQNRYVAADRFADIGGADYQREFRADLAAEDLAEPPATGFSRLAQNMREDLSDGWDHSTTATAFSSLPARQAAPGRVRVPVPTSPRSRPARPRPECCRAHLPWPEPPSAP